MSRFIKALTDMMQGNSKNGHKKVTEPEKFHRSEFKNLITQDIVPVKRSHSSKYKHMKNLPDSDSELMNEREITPCVY